MSKIQEPLYRGLQSQPHARGKDGVGPRRTWAEKHSKVDVRKVPANSVPFGEQVSGNGKTVWAVYLDGVLLCLGRTAKEAKHNYYGANARLDAHKLQQQKKPCAD